MREIRRLQAEFVRGVDDMDDEGALNPAVAEDDVEVTERSRMRGHGPRQGKKDRG
jgi:hypothetical protein